jgi:SAM-dependent methyltransferase
MSAANTTSTNLKKLVKGIPVIGSTARKLIHLPVFARVRRHAFPGSAAFWEDRYQGGGSSGSGSFGRLANFKAEVLNEFVQEKRIRRVIELGCGDGAQLELAEYPEYVGVDVAASPIERCRTRFAQDSTKQFYLADALPTELAGFDLALSLDVIYHLVEDPIFDSYMRSLFARSQRYVAIYASNYDAFTEAPHVRHRHFSVWIAKNMPDWHPAGFVANRFPFDRTQPNDTSFADFHFFASKTVGAEADGTQILG